MKTKYTPGKWEIHGQNLIGEILIGKKGEIHNSGKIVRVGWGCCGQESEEWKANARLIASAPEMFMELKNAVVTIEKLLSLSNFDSDTKAIYKHEIELHKQVLKKATGEDNETN